MIREDLGNARAELAAHPTAVTAGQIKAPGNDGAVGFERREGASTGEDPNDTEVERSSHRTAVAAIVGEPPGDDRAIGLERPEGAIR